MKLARGPMPIAEHRGSTQAPSVGPTFRRRVTRGDVYRLLALTLAHTFTATLLVALFAPALAAQRLRGEVLFPDSISPAAHVIVIATDATGADVAKAMSGETGAFDLLLPRSGRYRVRVLRLGFRPTLVAPVEVAAEQVRTLRIVLSVSIVWLAEVRVRGQSVCGVREDSGPLVADLWQQARFALLSTQLSAAGELLEWTTTSYERTLDPLGVAVRAESVTVVRGATARPFGSVPADSLAGAGYVVEDKTGVNYRAPDAEVLLSESFAALHCFTAVPPPSAHPDWVGLSVTPARERVNISDIDGTLWLDRTSAELRRFEYRYTGIPEAGVLAGAGGHVEFTRLPTGQWIVNRWEIRMPRYVLMRSVEGIGTWAREVTRTRVHEILVKGGEVLTVDRAGVALYQSRDATLDAQLAAPDARISGAGAQFELSGTRYAKVADSAGRARLEHVRPGRYVARILTTAMFRAGAPAAERTIEVAADTTVTTVRMMLPSADDLLRTVCGDSVAAGGDALLYGVVADSLRRALGTMRVAVSWQRDSFAIGRSLAPRSNVEEHEVEPDASGRWRFCGVPRDRALRLRTRALGLGETVVAVRVPLAEPAVEVTLPDSAARTLLAAARPVVAGRGTILRGRVTQVGDTTIAVLGAHVAILGTDVQGVTNGDGRFQFYGAAPPGRYEVRIRRIGYLPTTVRVVLDAGRPVEQNVALRRAPNTLRTVVVQGRKVDVPPGFEDVYARAARGFADFFTREDIERFGVMETSSLLWTIPGIQVLQDSLDFARCKWSPLDGRTAKIQVYLDGVRMTTHVTRILDIVQALHEIPPFTIQAMEVYRGVARIPGEFLDDACAVIAIWSKK